MDSLLFHPKVIHIPIALAVLMPMITLGALLAWWREWLPARAWVAVVILQAVLVGSGIVALRTGESEEDRVEGIVAERFIEAHEEAAERFTWAAGGTLAIMIAALALSRTKSGLPVASGALLATLAVLALGYQTGEAGGSLVYRHGAAQVYVGANAPQPDAGMPEADDD